MEFTSSSLHNFNFVERIKSLLSIKTKSFLNLKYSFCRPLFRPLDYVARGDRTTRPTLATPLAAIRISKKQALCL
jgi:hypothetical protein